jgi:hypothetical protein
VEKVAGLLRRIIFSAMKVFRAVLLVSISMALLVGCASYEKRVNRLELGMNQAQVERLLGSNFTNKAARVEADGTQTRLLEFTHPRQSRTIWVFFRNERVVQWGSPESLRHFPQHLEEVGRIE